MNELHTTDEQLIQNFVYELAMIDGPDDMFPPDSMGVREPRRPILPNLDGNDRLALAAVYDMAVARQNRRSIMGKSGASILEIDNLVTV